MSQPLILLIDQQGLHVWQTQGRGQALACVQHFNRNAADEQRFGDFLGRHHERAFIAVANLPGERYHNENAPRLNHAERQLLHADRLQQRFPEQRWRCARQFPNPSHGDELLCLLALDSSPEISSWMKLLRVRNTPLLALYSLAQGAAAFMRDQGPSPEQLLLLSRHDDQLRLSWLIQGQLHASRLQALPETRQLLMRCQDFLLEQSPEPPGNSPPAVLAIGVAQPLDGAWPAWQTLDTPPEATAHFLASLLRHPPLEQLAGNDERRLGRRYRQAQTLHVLTRVILGLALFLGILLYSEMRAQQEARDEAHGRLLKEEQKLQAVQAEMARLPWPATVLQQMQTGHDRLLLQHRALRDSLMLISQGLDQQSDIVLDALSWESGQAGGLDYGSLRLQIEASVPATPTATSEQAVQRFLQHLSTQSEVEVVRPPGRQGGPGRFVLRLKLRSTA